MPLILLLLLALPLIEIAVLIMVGASIGVLPTIGLVVFTGMLGVFLLRTQGVSTLMKIRSEMDRGVVPDKSLADAAMIAVAGLFLLLPGFISDVIGILLFLPPVRALIRSFIGRRVTVVRQSASYTHESDVVDLEPDEWQRRGGEPSPWRRIDRTGDDD